MGAEMLTKKQKFFDERAAYLLSQENERKEEEEEYLLLVKDALVEQQKLYEDDLKNQGIMLQSMLQRDERTREEVEKQNAKSQYRANMKSEIAGMAEQIEKLKKELLRSKGKVGMLPILRLLRCQSCRFL